MTRWQLVVLIPLLTSCSVMMASKREGFDLEAIQSAHHREQFLDLGGHPIASEIHPEGGRTEVYQILQQKGSAARALMHGLLDLTTAFLWEFAGSPIESALSQEKYYLVQVTFDDNDEVKRLELR